MREQTFILRHRKENLKKCSLTGLEGREGIHFFTYPFTSPLPPLGEITLLSLDAPLLSASDQLRPLFLIDATWKYARVMERMLPQEGAWIKRRLPTSLRTAYPRKQTACSAPERGLASIEALYAAYQILGWESHFLLNHYRWKAVFLELNPFILEPLSKTYRIGELM